VKNNRSDYPSHLLKVVNSNEYLNVSVQTIINNMEDKYILLNRSDKRFL